MGQGYPVPEKSRACRPCPVDVPAFGDGADMLLPGPDQRPELYEKLQLILVDDYWLHGTPGCERNG